MRTLIDVRELETFKLCPQKEKRRKLDDKVTQIERDYQARLRILLVRFYSAMLDGELLTEAQVRRIWSTLWEVTIQTSRQFEKHNASFLNAMMSPEEKMLVRGTAAINKLTARKLNEKMRVMVVDEDFSLERDGFTLTGTFDLALADVYGNFVLVDWTHWTSKVDHPQDLRQAVMLEAFAQRFDRKATLLTDYILTLGDYMVPGGRSPQEQTLQVTEAFQVARALGLETDYRNEGAWCMGCPYRDPCISGKIEPNKRPTGRPRKHPLPTAKGERLR